MTRVSQSNSFIDSLVLNTIQKKAVLHNDGPLLLYAGAGTGKTRVLTSKIAFLILEAGLLPQNIFAATFTNKAASEMCHRVEELTSIPCNGLWIGTFHSLCARILRRESHAIGYTSSFTIYDTVDQLSLIKKVMKELAIDERSMQPKQLLRIISNYKNSCKQYRDIENTGKTYFEKEVIRAYGLYQKKLKASSAMDFDDLLNNTVYLLRDNPSLLETYRKRFKYILVDEYQDTNYTQFQLIKLLAQKHNKIFVVGDDDQSIYSWRGARVENILNFDREFPETRVFKLEQNYRSTQPILEFANAIIRSNKHRTDKKLWTSLKHSGDVIVTRYSNDRQEALGIAEKIIQLRSNNVKLGNIALLFRTNAQSRVFEDAFRKYTIPYIIVGGTSFYERKEVKDCLAYLRLLANPKDTVSCERIINVPPRGIGDKTMKLVLESASEKGITVLETLLNQEVTHVAKRTVKGLDTFRNMFLLLSDLHSKNTPPHTILLQMLSTTGYMDMYAKDNTEETRSRVENINELVNVLTLWSEENPGKTLSHFLEEISLVSSVDGWKQDGDSVSLMTLHSAKGLEFQHVFLVGLEDGLIPSKQNFDDAEKLEEECRLLYVGATRAIKTLECSYALDRMRFGSILSMDVSRFIDNISKSLYRFDDHGVMVYHTSSFNRNHSSGGKRSPKRVFTHNPPTKNISRKKLPAQPRYDEFSQETIQFRIGQIVAHNKYGQGKILSLSGFGDDMNITVLFNDGSRKKMMAKFAKLQIQ